MVKLSYKELAILLVIVSVLFTVVGWNIINNSGLNSGIVVPTITAENIASVNISSDSGGNQVALIIEQNESENNNKGK